MIMIVVGHAQNLSLWASTIRDLRSGRILRQEETRDRMLRVEARY